MNDRSRRLAIVRELLETPLKDWTRILNGAKSSSSIRRFHRSISACSVCAEKVRIVLKEKRLEAKEHLLTPRGD